MGILVVSRNISFIFHLHLHGFPFFFNQTDDLYRLRGSLVFGFNFNIFRQKNYNMLFTKFIFDSIA